jgi:hypothetical protein
LLKKIAQNSAKPGLPDFLLQHTKTGKITKFPKYRPNGH